MKSCEDRNSRIFEGTLTVSDLLGNEIIRLKMEDQTPITPAKKLALQKYWDINRFEDNKTHFAAETYEISSSPGSPPR